MSKLSGANTPEARHFRALLDEYVSSLIALKAFISEGKLDPLEQSRLATLKDESRDRLFLWGRTGG